MCVSCDLEASENAKEKETVSPMGKFRRQERRSLTPALTTQPSSPGTAQPSWTSQRPWAEPRLDLHSKPSPQTLHATPLTSGSFTLPTVACMYLGKRWNFYSSLSPKTTRNTCQPKAQFCLPHTQDSLSTHPLLTHKGGRSWVSHKPGGKGRDGPKNGWF